MSNSIRVDEVAFHRNGVSGEGFHALLFREREGRHWRKFLASVFEGPGVLSVICLDLVAEHGVASFENAWRGDHYEPHLRKAIAEYEEARRIETLRVCGPAPHKVNPRSPRRVADV